MSTEASQAWIALLEAVRAELDRPDKDYGWTPWADAVEARAAIDALLQPLRRGAAPDAAALALLFAPTGALQELALGSGWSTAYLAYAAEADRLLARHQSDRGAPR